jgi:SpoIID/LytB domain protein
VYTGVTAETPAVRHALAATRGLTLHHDGKPIHAVFSSNCGGHAQSGEEAGWGSVPYWRSLYEGPSHARAPASPLELREWLQGEPEAFCRNREYVWPAEFRWNQVLSPDELTQRLRKHRHKLGAVDRVLALRRSAGGHIRTLKVRGSRGSLYFRQEHTVRRALGAGSLRSNLLLIETQFRAGRPFRYVFYGAGWGHGVGLCQGGATGRAAAGADFAQILGAYFPGTTLRSVQ